MTNLTLQPYSTKQAKHHPPDFRNPTEKGESAGLHTHTHKNEKKRKKKREEVTCFKLCNPRPQVTLHKKTNKQKKKLGPVPEGRTEERESRPHLSMVSARVSSSCAHRQRYTHSPKPSPTFPRYQFTNSHANRREKGEGGFFTAAILAFHGLKL